MLCYSGDDKYNCPNKSDKELLAEASDILKKSTFQQTCGVNSPTVRPWNPQYTAPSAEPCTVTEETLTFGLVTFSSPILECTCRYHYNDGQGFDGYLGNESQINMFSCPNGIENHDGVLRCRPT